MPTPLRFSIARAVSKDSKIQKSLAFLLLRMLSTNSRFQGLDALKTKIAHTVRGKLTHVPHEFRWMMQSRVLK